MKGLKALDVISTVSSEEFIGTKEAADILGISQSTVRRLANTGKLICYKIQYNNYRKFKLTEVLEFKEQNLKVTPVSSNEESSQLSLELDFTDSHKKSLKNITAKSHPAHYLMHKYWGRKPHNVVADYIEYYTKPGDTILDPFAGSGMTPIEAIKLNRHGIGIDINPMSKFIALNTVSNVDLKDYTNIANSILSTVSQKLNRLYETKCPHCEGIGYIETAIWENDVITRIKGKCINDGTFIKDADGYDRSIYEEIHKEKLKLDADGSISYPKDKVLKYVKRSGKESIDELFTSRALIILSNLRNAIFEVEDEEIKSLLLFTFTSMLANVSNMLPGDIEKATYKSGWVISKFWTPKIHTERNIFHCFKLRMKAIVKGKNELLDVSQDLLTYENQDSSNLHFLEDNSIDYIFTDPPYGESIAYLALSQFWNSWLNNDVDYENEIIVDSYRNKDYIDYAQRMLNTFRELYRVLKPGHYLSFTFHNRDLNVWKSVIDAYKDAGFILQEIILQEQAVSSGTQGINKMNTLTGDFVYTLWKPFEQNSVEQNKHENRDNIEFLKQLISNIITTHKTITPSKLYEKLIPIVTKEECYFDENGKVIDIEKILKENYQYIKDESNTKLGDYYVWKIKQ